MSWRRAFGALAVLLVVAMVFGTVVTLLTSNDLLWTGSEQVPALLSLALVGLALAVAILLSHPSRDWIGNPYW